MHNVLQARQEIYDYFESTASCRKYFSDAANNDDFVAYFNSKFLLQDSTESLWQHRRDGFSREPLAAYLEFWGLMQATFIQQDATKELYQLIVGLPLDPHAFGLKAWLDIRELRRVCAGHPAKADRSKPIVRTFMGRQFGGYDRMMYERWEQGVGTTHPHVSLGALIDAYSNELAQQLASILTEMKVRWP